MQAATSSPDLKALSRVPIRFEPAKDGGSYNAGWPGYRFSVSATGWRLQVPGKGTQPRTLSASIVNADAHASSTGSEKLPGGTSYFRGNDKTKWQTSVASFRKVQYENVLPGIGLVYRGEGDHFEFDFVVKENSDPSSIRMKFSGFDAIETDEDGNLILTTGGTRIVQQMPCVYQEVKDSLRLVSARYAVLASGEVGFVLGPYDRSKPLVIDPEVVYSGFFAGFGTDTATAIGRDAKGFLYIGGTTTSSSVSASDGAAQVTSGGDQDLFVIKVDPNAPASSAVVYTTYFGGSGADELGDMLVTPSGSVYLTGTTASTNFPVTGGASQSALAGDHDAFVVNLDLSNGGSALIYATYVGGALFDSASSIAVDNDGNAYITGYTTSTDFPVLGGAFQSTNAGNRDGFLAQVNAAGAISYSSYLGGQGTDVGQTVLLQKDGTVVVVGFTSSPDFPLVGKSFDVNYRDLGDVFVTRISLSRGILYSTYLGGSDLDEIKEAALNSAGQVVLTGFTLSNDFPLTANAYQRVNSLAGKAFLSVLDISGTATGSPLVYSSFFGGSEGEVPTALRLDATGKILVAGYTFSSNLPVTSGAYQTQTQGGVDGFFAKFDPTLSGSAGLLYSSYVGGPANDIVYGLDVDPAGRVALVGTTNSRHFPLPDSPLRATYPGDFDAFVLLLKP